MSKIKGIYVEIRGDTSHLATDMKKARDLVKTQTKGISDAFNNAVSEKQVRNSVNRMVADLNKIYRAVKIPKGSFDHIAADLGEFTKLTGLAEKEFHALQRRMLENRAAEQQRKALENIARAAGLSRKETLKLGKQLGMTREQMEELNRSARQTAKGLGRLTASAKGFVTGVSIYTIGGAAKGILDTKVQVDSLERSFVAITGSQKAARQEMEYWKRASKKYGQNFYEVADMLRGVLASVRGSALEGKDIRGIIESSLATGTVMGNSPADIQGVLRAYMQIISKGVVMKEELSNQLGERLYGIFQMAAKEMGKTDRELSKLIERGEVLPDELLPAIKRGLMEVYGETAKTAALEAGSAALNLFTSEWTRLKDNLVSGETAFAPIRILTTALEGLNFVLDKLRGKSELDTSSIFDEVDTPKINEKNESLRKRVESFLGFEEGENPWVSPALRRDHIAKLRNDRIKKELGALNSLGNLLPFGGAAASELINSKKPEEQRRKLTAEYKKADMFFNQYYESLKTNKEKLLEQKAELEKALKVLGEDVPKGKVIVAFAAINKAIREAENQGKTSAEAFEAKIKELQASYKALTLSGRELDKFKIEQEAKKESDWFVEAGASVPPVIEMIRQIKLKILDEEARKQIQEKVKALDDEIARLTMGEYEHQRHQLKVKIAGLKESGLPASKIEAYRKAQSAAIDKAEKAENQRKVNDALADISRIAEAQRKAQQEMSSQYRILKIGDTRFAIEQLKKEIKEKKAIPGVDHKQVDAVYGKKITELEDQAMMEALRASGHWEDGLHLGLKGYAKEVGTFATEVENVVKNAFRGMEDSLTEFVTTGKADISSFVNAVVADFVRLTVRMAVTSQIAQGFIQMFGFSSAGGAGGAPVGHAKGGVPGAAGLHRYVNTVVDKPTIFPYARGGTFGLMGEAGAEAIMPLKKMPGGELGIRAETIAPNIQVNIHEAPGTEAEVRTSEDGTTMDIFIQQIEGALTKRMARGQGLAQSLDNRYGRKW